MTDSASPVPVKTDETKNVSVAKGREWHPLETLRREVDRLFDDFDLSAWRSSFSRSLFDVEPLWRRDWTTTMPAIDIVEHEKDYRISAELPGIDESNVEVKLSNGKLLIRGEKQDEKEEKKENFYLSERRYGSFERMFRVPDGVDAEKIDASFKKGVLTVILPKSPEAQKGDKKITVKAA